MDQERGFFYLIGETAKRFLRSNLPLQEDTLEERRAMLINSFSVMGIALFVGFAFIHYLFGQYFVATVYVVFVASLIGNLVFLRFSKKVEASSELSVAMTFVILVYIFIHGGIFETGIFWTFSFIPIAFFLLGLYRGLTVSFMFLLVLFFAKLTQDFGYIKLDYDSRAISFFFFFLGFLLFLISFWSAIAEKDESLLRATNLKQGKLNSKLTTTVNKLEEKQEKQKLLIEAFDKSIVEVQKKNKTLEDQSNEIQQEKAKDEALLSSLGEGMMATDPDQKIIVFNRQGQKTLGFSAKEVIGKKFHEVIKAYDENGVRLSPQNPCPYNLAFKTGKLAVRNDIQYRRKDGALVPVVVTASPIIVDGKSEGIVTVFRDVTQERQIDRAKTEFVSLASHQLRTPLSAANWYVEMLLSGDAGKINADQKGYLNEIHRGNRRLAALVNSLLNVSRIDLGKFKVEPKLLSLAKLAKDSIGEVSGIVKKKNLKVKTVFSKSVPRIKADENLLRIIFQNLLSNAVKYTPDKGEISISVRKKDKNAVVKVGDTGIGIPEDQVEKVFEKLFRADNVLKTDTDGTGLGLYIVKQILNETGGRIGVESVLNKGTTFTVSLPKSGMKKHAGSRRLTN